jgi:hypothetical protein
MEQCKYRKTKFAADSSRLRSYRVNLISRALRVVDRFTSRSPRAAAVARVAANRVRVEPAEGSSGVDQTI